MRKAKANRKGDGNKSSGGLTPAATRFVVLASIAIATVACIWVLASRGDTSATVEIIATHFSFKVAGDQKVLLWAPGQDIRRVFVEKFKSLKVESPGAPSRDVRGSVSEARYSGRAS